MAIDIAQTNLSVDTQNAQQAISALSLRESQEIENQEPKVISATLELANRANDQRESADNTDIETASVPDIEIESAVAEVSEFVQSHKQKTLRLSALL